jgi:hypothetical protein
MDLPLQLLKEDYKGNQGKLRKLETWSKPYGIFQEYLEKAKEFRLSDEQKVELDASVKAQRVASGEKVDAAWQKVVDMKDKEIKGLREDRDRCDTTYRELYEKAYATVCSYQSREARWHAFVQGRMDVLEKFEVYAEQQVFELDEARKQFCVEAATFEVLKDSIKYLKKTRKRKQWGGDRRSTKYIALKFATQDVKGAKTADGSMTRVSTMLSMASHQPCRTLRHEAYQRPEILHSPQSAALQLQKIQNWPIAHRLRRYLSWLRLSLLHLVRNLNPGKGPRRTPHLLHLLSNFKKP